MRTSTRLGVAALAVGAALGPAVSAQGLALSGGRENGVVATHHPAKAPTVLHPPITAAAWFQPDPLCGTPLGCGFIPLPALDPYPTGTFHIGTAVGRQTARAFIAVSLGKQAAGARGGRLTIPLDTDPADGSLDPQAAKVNVCVTYQAVPDVEGGFDGAPSANCLPAAHAEYVGKPLPHLVADLTRLAGGLSGVKGFALLPADAAPTTAWQLVFRLSTATAAMRPTLSLMVGAMPDAAAVPNAPHHLGDRGPGSAPASSTPGAGVPEPALPPKASTVVPGVSKPVVAQPTSATGRYLTIGYQYPEVWLLPLGLLVLIPFTVRALTKDLTRRR